MDQLLNENLCHDPIHGYIAFVASEGEAEREICERQIIDDPWVQRMRQIRQLQTAWWVFPTAEHSRFQHILGVMHLASQAVTRLHDSLKSVDSSTPPKAYVDGLMRMAGLLHDVGHGPFGHFFDEHFLSHFGLTHERLGAAIIEQRLGAKLQGLRRSPMGQFSSSESGSGLGSEPNSNTSLPQLNPADVAWLIQRPTASGSARTNAGSTDQAALAAEDKPFWLHCLRSLFCGIYTVDNMDFVLRDAFMTGLNPRSFDLSRILHYSSFTPEGLTIHERGVPALVHFLSMKAELFRSVYFHRTVRAIDIELAELFRVSRDHLFPGNPLENLDAYLEFTEFSLLTDVRRWHRSQNPELQKLGGMWSRWLGRDIPWILVCQRDLSFAEGQSEKSSVFSNAKIFKEYLKDQLPAELRSIPFAVDLARHIHRPHTVGATAGMNFYYDMSTRMIRPLTMHGLYRKLPVSHTIVRIYTHDREHETVFASLLDGILGGGSTDDLTNM